MDKALYDLPDFVTFQERRPPETEKSTTLLFGWVLKRRSSTTIKQGPCYDIQSTGARFLIQQPSLPTVKKFEIHTYRAIT